MLSGMEKSRMSIKESEAAIVHNCNERMLEWSYQQSHPQYSYDPRFSH